VAIKPNADPIQRVLANLAKRAAAKPRTVKTLRSSIKNLLGVGTSEETVNKLVGELERLNAIKVADRKVTYPS
jgi:CRP-like cAMP-binding protein